MSFIKPEGPLQKEIVEKLDAIASIHRMVNLSLGFHREMLAYPDPHVKKTEILDLIGSNNAMVLMALTSFTKSLNGPGGVLNLIQSDLKKINDSLKNTPDEIISGLSQHSRKSIFEPVLQRILSNRKITTDDIALIKGLLTTYVEKLVVLRNLAIAHPYERMTKAQLEQIKNLVSGEHEDLLFEGVEKTFLDIREMFAVIRFIAVPEGLFREDLVVNGAKMAPSSSACRELVQFARGEMVLKKPN